MDIGIYDELEQEIQMNGYSCDRQCEEMIDMRMSDYWPMMGLTIFKSSGKQCFQDMTVSPIINHRSQMCQVKYEKSG